MRIIHFYDSTNILKLRVDSFDDLYLIQRITTVGDGVEARSFRHFRPNESDEGEQKEVRIKIGVEKVELDKAAAKLRFTGKTLSGHPEDFVRLGSYHTLSVGPGDEMELQKNEWRDYIIRRIKQAVAETRKPRLGAIAMDDEKATVAYIKGYGIEIVTEIYSHLSKKMKEQEFAKQKESYFNELISSMKNMPVDTVILAGPGFTKDDLRKYMADSGIDVGKRLVAVHADDAERSGIRHAMQSSEISKVLEQEHVRKEFDILNLFFQGLRVNASYHGAEQVNNALNSYTIGIIMVNDSAINDPETQRLLDKADSQKVRIEIFNSEDEAGMQLAHFNGIAGISKAMMASS